MSRLPFHTLIWFPEQSLYEFYAQGQLEQRFRPADEAAWQAWLGSVTSFAFHGAAGSLNVYQESRPRGGQYWYAYHTSRVRTRKHYLGRAERVSFARLEEAALILASEPEPPERVASHMPPPAEHLQPLPAKLALPRLPHALVDRERLLLCLDEAFSTPLTLISAPAGWGKTTLLAAWARRHRMQVAWLSLDELDTSPTRFWVALIAALRRGAWLGPQFGGTAVEMLESPQPPPLSACLEALLQELARRESHPAPLVLIVDDYQVIEEPGIHQSLSFFVEHLPDSLHLVLASRVDPDLPLSRWRVRGQLTEIRADELRFGEGEARQFLDKMLSPMPSAEEVRLLTLRTEGWIAGLHLVALAMQKREDRAAFLQTLTGSQRYLLDYVQEDILAPLPPPVRDFLLHSAILSRLDASVCQVVTAASSRAASQRMLVFLERANLFLVPLDDSRHSYRLHELFREALLTCLHATQPELIPVLHRRAADFFEAQGEQAEAIVHWFEARNFIAAANLMEQTVEQFWLRGEAATMARWALALPEPQVREHARLVLTTALYLLSTVPQTTGEQRARVHQRVRQLMARVETALWPQGNDTSHQPEATDAGSAFSPAATEARDAEEAVLRRRLGLLRAQMAWFEAIAAWDVERLNALHQQMQELDQDEEAIWQLLPLFSSFVLHYTIRQEGAVLLPRLLEARQRVSQSGSHFAAIRVMQWLALSAGEAGQLRLAYQESLAALALLERIKGYSLLKGYFEEDLALVLYEWNRLEEARDKLRTVIGDARAWQHSDLLLSGYLFLMEVELASGDLSAVQQALQEFEQLEAHKGYGPHRHWLPVMRARWWLAWRQVKEASDWAAGVVFPQGAWDDFLYGAFPVVIRVYVAQRRWTEAASLLDRFREHLDRPANIRITITYLAQSLVALHHTGRSEQAREVGARLFALTEPEGHLRVYLDEGEPMRQALEALLTPHSQQHEFAASTRAYIAKLLAAFKAEKQGVSTSLGVTSPLQPALSPTQQASVVSSAPVEPLTQREQEVLRLLSQGASNQQIADALVIELSTAKKHVSNLLSKLGAESRTQAISRARTLSLL